MKKARSQADIVSCGPEVYQGCNIRVEEWVREFISVVRLTFNRGAIAKAKGPYLAIGWVWM